MIPLRDNIPTWHFPMVTRLVVTMNVLVFLFELRLSPEALNALSYLFCIVPARFSHPGWAMTIGLPIHEYWPFLTSMFLHASWLHLIGNMWFLIQLFSGTFAAVAGSQMGGVAWWAHVGGFLAGLSLYRLFLSSARAHEHHADELGLLAAWVGRAKHRRRS